MPSAKDNVQAFIYTKSKKLRNVFIYKKPDTFQKARQFTLRFIYKKKDTLRHKNFMKFLNLACIYKKHDILRYVTFYIQKYRHFAKSMTICVTFLCTTSVSKKYGP